MGGIFYEDDSGEVVWVHREVCGCMFKRFAHLFADLSWVQFQTTLLQCSQMMWGRQNKRKLKWRVLILRRSKHWFILLILVSIDIPLADFLRALVAEVWHPQTDKIFFVVASGQNTILQTQTNCFTYCTKHSILFLE